MSEVLRDWLIKLTTDFSDSALSVLLTIFSSVVRVSTSLLDSEIIKNATSYAQALATVLLALKLITDIYKSYMANVTGERSDVHPSGYVVRGIAALLLIWTVPYIVGQIVEVGNRISVDLASTSGAQPAATDYITQMKQNFNTEMNSLMIPFTPMFSAIGGLVLGIAMIIVCFQIAKRSVEIAILCIIGPVFSVNMASEDQSLYKNWIKHLIIVCVSQALQIFLLRLSFWVGTHQWDLLMSSYGLSLLMNFALLIFTIKTPKYLEQFSYGSGGGGGGAAVAHMASNAINLIGKAK